LQQFELWSPNYGCASKELAMEFRIIDPKTKQNHMHILGSGKANGFAGKSLEKTSITTILSDFNKQKNSITFRVSRAYLSEGHLIDN
jgi:hypothetical protein